MASSGIHDDCDHDLIFEQLLEKIKIQQFLLKKVDLAKEYTDGRHDLDIIIELTSDKVELLKETHKALFRSLTEAKHPPLGRVEEPPSWAEKLLYLVLSNQDRAAIPGDLQEEFQTVILPKFGYAYARIWYWKQVLRSVWPLARGLGIRIAACAGIWKAIEVALRKIGL